MKQTKTIDVYSPDWWTAEAQDELADVSAILTGLGIKFTTERLNPATVRVSTRVTPEQWCDIQDRRHGFDAGTIKLMAQWGAAATNI